MSQYTYFTMPFESLPQSPGYTVWFATWSTQRPTDQDAKPLVVCCTTGVAPQGATVLVSSALKDPPPPPPPPLSVTTSDYSATLAAWLAAGRSL
jgi:hypothetical protein